jgi:hypothetical protein
MESCEKAVNIGTLPKMDCLTPGAGAEDKRAEDKPQLMLYSGAIFARLLLALFVID